MDLPQLFWDAYRRRWRARLARWIDGSGTRAWTRTIIEAAREAVGDYGTAIGREVVVGCEGHGRIDVHGEDPRTGNLLVAFESELAPWGWNGASGKDWREEFPKLCRTRAELRVLSATFDCGAG